MSYCLESATMSFWLESRYSPSNYFCSQKCSPYVIWTPRIKVVWTIFFEKICSNCNLSFFPPWNYVSALCAEQSLHGFLPCAEQNLHCSHPCAKQSLQICSAHGWEQCRLCSTHGREPCSLCSAHRAETLFQGQINNKNCKFRQFSKGII